MTEEHLQAYKNEILRYAEKGLDFERACLLGNVDDPIVLQLSADREFMRYYEQKLALLEYTLLEHVISIATIKQAQPSSVEARWLLAKLNKKRWGSVAGVGEAGGEYRIPSEYDGV